MIAADGKIDPAEEAVAIKIGSQLFGDFDATRFKQKLKEHAKLPNSRELAWMLRDNLDSDQKEAVFRYILAIARADGTLSEEEMIELDQVATGLDLDFEALRSKLPEHIEGG